MRVVIGGGSGFVGRALTAALRRRGDAVTIISRSPGDNRLTWDALKQNGLPECDAVVNLTGANLFSPRPWTTAFRQEVVDSRIQSTAALVDSMLAAGQPPKVFVCASGINYYPGSSSFDVPEVTEDAPPGNDFMAQLARDWEAAAARASPQVRVVSMRSGVVLGRDGGAFAQMRLPFLLGLGGRLGAGTQPFPWIHIDDAVGLYIHALDNANLSGPVNMVAPETVSNAEFTRTLASALHRPAIIPMPGFVLNILMGAERAVVLLEGSRARPKAALDSGFAFQHATLHSAIDDLTS